MVLAGDRYFRADLPGQPTHVISLSALPEGSAEAGVVAVNVRPEPMSGGAPGLQLSLSLDSATFRTSFDELAHLFERC